MSGLSWIDIFLRLIPEGLLIILAGYAVSKKAIDAKLYLFSSVILALVTYVLKILPISAALPMILSAIAAVLLLVFINRIKVLHSVISTIICMLLSLLLEGLNLFLLEVFKVDTYEVFKDATPFTRYLYGLPSLLLFAAMVLAYYFINKKIRAKKNERLE